MRNDASTDQILDGRHGTTFILKVRQDIKFENVADNLKSWIVIPQCKVEYKENDFETIRIGYDTEHDAIKNYLNSIGINDDNKTFRIKEKFTDGIKFYF